MDYIFDAEKLERVIGDFYTCTGIAATLYDSAMNQIAASPAYTDYCRRIRRCEDCVRGCVRSNLVHMRQALSSGQACPYGCHAGLMEIILPIVYEDVPIAYMQIGQFRDEEEVYASPALCRRAAKEYGIPEEELEALRLRVPTVSAEKLRALRNLLETLIRSFWTDGLIYSRRSMLSVKIDRYVHDRLSEPISVDELCSAFLVSKNALYRLFHEEFHAGVNEYILQQRLKSAEERLRTEPERNVTQIAAACGFGDYNYFIRVFRKTYGLTPLQYRKKRLLQQ